MKVQVEIPDSVAAEWEVVGYRSVNNGEWVLNSKGEPIQLVNDLEAPWLVLVRKWQWPAGFEGVAAMARTPGGGIVAYSSIPRPDCDGWGFDHKASHIADWMHPNLNFPRPDRWQDSLRINPNFKQ